ncbi:MAG: carbohydrate ABC transporter permease [Chloroflexota bacterium]
MAIAEAIYRNRQRARLWRNIQDFLSYFVLLLALVVALFPLYWMITASFKTEVELFSQPPTLFPQRGTWEGYIDLFANRNFGRSLFNSLVVVGSSLMLAMMMGTLAAYSLARFRLPAGLNSIIGFWILSTRMLPPIASIVPIYLIIQALNLLNTYAGLALVYVVFDLPFVIWMMRSFFQEIPVDLEEASMVDGASRLGAFWRVVLPLVRPGLAATAIFIIIDSYNEFLFALILSSTPDVMTMPVAAATLVGRIHVVWGSMTAGGAVAMLPILVFVLLMQRHLVRGLTLGAIK